MDNSSYVIGLDFGSDSVRAILVDTRNGEEIAESVHYYTRWKEGLYCDANINQFRQHPLDYLEGLESTIIEILDSNRDIAHLVRAISVDTTASTPALADKHLVPLAMHSKYENNPNAMFVLWKDHTGEIEANEINKACANSDINYSKFTGYHYSSECFWAKVLHLLRSDKDIQHDAYTVVECCDWIPAVLTGNTSPLNHKMGHCCAGQKMFWSEEWGGFPPRDFFESIDPILLPILDTLHPAKYTCDKPYGIISPEWALKLGLPTNVVIGVGNVDSHQGAIGAGIAYKTAVINLGTSAGCMVVMPKESIGDRIINGVFGQVDSCILPNMIGFEVGLSAFGDVYAWFKRILEYPLQAILANSKTVSPGLRQELIDEISDGIMKSLTIEASALPLRDDAPFATDWLNGRRSPAPNQRMWGSVMGLHISTSAPEIYYALVESTAFAIRAIIDHLINNGIEIENIIGVGGISQKSPFVMQMLADVTGKSINVSECKQSCALGSAICASVVCGIYKNIESAQKVMCRSIMRVYEPNPSLTEHFERRYALYRATDTFTQEILNKNC